MILMAFTAGLEQLPTCKKMNNFSLIKIDEQEPVFPVLLWGIMLGVFLMSGKYRAV